MLVECRSGVVLQVIAPYGVRCGVGEESMSQRTEEDIRLTSSQLLRKNRESPSKFVQLCYGVDEVCVCVCALPIILCWYVKCVP